MAPTTAAAAQAQPLWAKVIDHTRCIGCHACSTACKSENEVPLSVNRTYVKYVDVGAFPSARRAFQVTRCNQCQAAPCVTACPTSAMYARKDGIVDFDKSICIGCKACIAACPYDAIFINPADNSAEKCNFCAHRIDMGLEPACVVVCPTEAILVGDLRDPESRVAQIVRREAVTVRRPEKETRPKLFYKGAHQATLDPLAAARPDGGLYVWSEQAVGHDFVPSGHPRTANSSAAALLAYDVPHRAPWDWRVSLYTWTKSISAGSYIVTMLLVLAGLVPQESALWGWQAPLAGLVFLAATGGLLIADLTHPERFFLIFTRGQRRSWLVRGAYVIAGYGAVLALHLMFAMRGSNALLLLGILGLPLALMTAVYTGYLFAQAKARDLWQNPLLPPHFAVQAVLAGAAALLLFTAREGSPRPTATGALGGVLALSLIVHLLLVLGETTLTHPTAHAKLATWELVRGRWRRWFWAGIVGGVAALGLLLFGSSVVVFQVAALLALAALFAHEHAYVQAGQSVPLA
jgi:Fe-S-cluster-containing dehydrogenase component/formate-dependent nitrite reductase membrane component NrfD